MSYRPSINFVSWPHSAVRVFTAVVNSRRSNLSYSTNHSSFAISSHLLTCSPREGIPGNIGEINNAMASSQPLNIYSDEWYFSQLVNNVYFFCIAHPTFIILKLSYRYISVRIPLTVITGSIAHSAKWRYLSYSVAILRFFAPQERHVAPMGWNSMSARQVSRSTPLCQISPPSVQG